MTTKKNCRMSNNQASSTPILIVNMQQKENRADSRNEGMTCKFGRDRHDICNICFQYRSFVCHCACVCMYFYLDFFFRFPKYISSLRSIIEVDDGGGSSIITIQEDVISNRRVSTKKNGFHSRTCVYVRASVCVCVPNSLYNLNNELMDIFKFHPINVKQYTSLPRCMLNTCIEHIHSRWNKGNRARTMPA